MGANAQTAVPAFTAGQVLTAAQQTQINTGIPVFATTVTRDAAFGGAGEKVLAQGQYAYIEATSTLQVYTGSAWITAISSGLNLISSTTIGTAVASVTVSNCFSSQYDNYKIMVSGGTSSTASTWRFTLGATATGYYYGWTGYTWAGASVGQGGANVAYIQYLASGNANVNFGTFDVLAPFLNKVTSVSGFQNQPDTGQSAGVVGGMLYDTTSYTGFTLTPGSGTITGGTIRVYGYANS
jgi:hypothetical protein